MQIKIVGMFRGSAKGYAIFQAKGCSPEDFGNVKVVVRASAGLLPCHLFGLKDEACASFYRLAVAFPLFDTRTVTLSISWPTNDAVSEQSREFVISNQELIWKSRFLHRFNHSLCDLVLYSEKAFQEERVSVEISQVFDSGKSLVYRAWIYGLVVDPSSLLLQNSDGSVIDETIRIIETQKENTSQKPFIVASFSLDKTIKSFSFGLSNCYFDAIDEIRSLELTAKRDGLMVNPSIDGIYTKRVGSIADEWSRFQALGSSSVSSKAKILFSVIVPLYCTPKEYLPEMIDSVLGQSYENWELVLVNASPECEWIKRIVESYRDPRILMIELDENLGIAGNTNVGITRSTGDYVAFLDHDDILSPTLLEEYAYAIERDQAVDLLYCDEDSFIERSGNRFSPLLKPNPNTALLYSHNYFVHCLTVSKRSLALVDLSSKDVDGAQDYDLTLKVLSVAEKSKHIPKVLYHWRVHPGSTNGGMVESKPYVIQAGVKALADGFNRRDVTANVQPSEISCVYDIDMSCCQRKSLAFLLVFHNCSQAQQLLDSIARVVDSLDNIAIVGRNASDLLIQDEVASKCVVRIIDWNEEYDYALMVNAAIELVPSDCIWLCREGIRDFEGLKINNLVGWLSQGEAGIVAPKLVYPDGLVQHAGLCIKSDGSIGYLNQNFTTHMGGGYLGTAECCCAYSAVSPDSLLFERELLEKYGGLKSFDSNALISVVDFCFWSRCKGKQVVVLPDSMLTNYAHVVRSDVEEWDMSSSNPALVQLWEAWGKEYQQDVLFNPAICLDNSYFQLSKRYFE